MNNTDSNDFQLFKTALREKDTERRKALLVEFSDRRVRKVKAKVANDPT